MKRFYLFCAVLVVLTGPVVMAEDDEKRIKDEGAIGHVFSTQIGSSLISPYVSANYGLLLQKSIFGIGGGVKSYFALQEAGVYLAPYGRLELSLLYFGLGVGIPVTQPDEEDAIRADVGPFLTIGTAPGFIPLGPGKLGIDLSADIMLTAVPRSDGENPLEDVVGDLFAVMLGTFKLFIGAAYRI